MARARKKNAVMSLFDDADRPIYLLDGDRQIQYCNEACCRWVNCRPEQLIGLRCDYHSRTAASSDKTQPSVPMEVAAGLCPSVDAFEGVRSVGVVATSGLTTAKRRQAEFIPVCQSDESYNVLILVDPDDLTSDPSPLPADAFDPAKLHDQVRQWQERQNDLFALDNLLGNSTEMHRVREQVRLAGAGDGSILAVGDPGTGRERILRTIHATRCKSKPMPLIPLDCQLLDSELIQSTMAGVVRQFAELQVEGAAELLLMDVDQLSLDAQATLLGFLHLTEFQLGTLATARTDLLPLAARGDYRSDLADQLSTLVITLPALAQRTDDLPMLVQAGIERENAEGGKQIQGVTERAMNLFLAHRWPGNVDQLFDFIRQAHLRAAGPLITEADLPDKIHLAIDADRHPHRQPEAIKLESYLATIERELIRRALLTAKGNKAQAARLLGVSRGRLLRRLECLEIES